MSYGVGTPRGVFRSTPPKSVFDNGEPRSPIQVTQPISHLLYVLGHWPWGVLLVFVFSLAAIQAPQGIVMQLRAYGTRSSSGSILEAVQAALQNLLPQAGED